MFLKRTTIAFFTFIFLGSTLAFGVEFKGLEFPSTVQIQGTTLKLNGLGMRSAYKIVHVYAGGLYLKEVKKNLDPADVLKDTSPKQIILKFLMQVEKNKIKDAWTEGFQKNKIEGYDYKSDLKSLNDLMMHMKKGDEMRFTFYPDKVSVQVKDQTEKTLEGRNLSETFLKVFIENPPDENLKNGMLAR